ncbi:uncharacterized protein UTRI_04700 [Ustilago trichophora]|uniref:Uncharacterized protein n=1 Tax=Ustilago trichophora TaxID=86804 RepID=A0A5C3ECB4_9BASI|nr:uncharacterized protein UTRI_04700 [Ustilago trichophora]
MPVNSKATRNRKPVSSDCILLNHIPPSLPWFFFAGVFQTKERPYVRRLEVFRDRTKRDTPEGEFFLIMRAPGSHGHKAVNEMVVKHGAKATIISTAAAKDLSRRFGIKTQDLRDLVVENTGVPPLSRVSTESRPRHLGASQDAMSNPRGDADDISEDDQSQRVPRPHLPSRRSRRVSTAPDRGDIVELISSDSNDIAHYWSTDSLASRYSISEDSENDESDDSFRVVGTNSQRDCGEQLHADEGTDAERDVPQLQYYTEDAAVDLANVSDIPSDAECEDMPVTAAAPPMHAEDPLPLVPSVPLQRGASTTPAGATSLASFRPASCLTPFLRIPLFQQLVPYQGSPFLRTRTGQDTSSFTQHCVTKRAQFKTKDLFDNPLMVAPGNPGPYVQEIFLRTWKLAEDKVRGSSDWYPAVPRPHGDTFQALTDDHLQFLARRPELPNFVEDYVGAQRLTDDFCKWFGLQRMHASALLEIINTNLVILHQIKVRKATRTLYADALGDDAHLYETGAEALMMIIDAIRCKPVEYDPDVYASLQEYRVKEWCMILAQVMSEEGNVVIRPSQLVKALPEYIMRMNGAATTLVRAFTGQRLTDLVVTKRVAGGSRFVRGALQADLLSTDCLIRPLGVLPEEEDCPPDDHQPYSSWTACNNLPELDWRKESSVLRAGSKAPAGCRLRIRAATTGRPMCQIELENSMSGVIKGMTPGNPTRGSKMFAGVSLTKVHFRHSRHRHIAEQGMVEVEFWFADRAQAGIAAMTIHAWIDLLPMHQPTHVELSDNNGFLHPLSCARTKVMGNWHLYFVLGSIGSKGSNVTGGDVLPDFARPISSDAETGEKVLKVGYSSPVQAAKVMDTRILLKTNTLNGRPVLSDTLTPHLQATMPVFSTRHDEHTCGIRREYRDNTQALIDRLLGNWRTATVFAKRHRKLLQALFAHHGTDNRAYQRRPATQANLDFFMRMTKDRLARSACTDPVERLVQARQPRTGILRSNVEGDATETARVVLQPPANRERESDAEAAHVLDEPMSHRRAGKRRARAETPEIASSEFDDMDQEMLEVAAAIEASIETRQPRQQGGIQDTEAGPSDPRRLRPRLELNNCSVCRSPP